MAFKGYIKEYIRDMSFMDMELSRIIGTSRTQKLLSEINKYID